MGTSGRVKGSGAKLVLKYIKSAASFLSTLVIISAVCISVMYIIGIRPYVVTSGSMEPAIPVKSICFVNSNVPFSDINEGEVITFKMGDDMLVTHRVTEISGGHCTTKGDANNAADAAYVTQKNYIGKTVLVIPKAGLIAIMLHSTAGKVCAGAAVALLLLISFIPEREKEPSGHKASEDNSERDSDESV